MENYELTVVLAGNATAAKKKSAQEAIAKIVKIIGGKVGKIEDWGKKELSYDIAKNDSGVFLHYNLELDGESVKMLPQKFNLEENIIRYLLVRKEEEK
jgi:small subunit ribosomal protein S6